MSGMTDERWQELNHQRLNWAQHEEDEVAAYVECLRAELGKLRAVEAELREELEQVTRLKSDIEKQFVDNCAIVQDYVQKHQLGLGGENIFKLIVRHAEELLGELARKQPGR